MVPVVVIERWSESREFRGYSVDGYAIPSRLRGVLAELLEPSALPKDVDEIVGVGLGETLKRYVRSRQRTTATSVVSGYPRFGMGDDALLAEYRNDPNRHLYFHAVLVDRGLPETYLTEILGTLELWVKHQSQYRDYEGFRKAAGDLLVTWAQSLTGERWAAP